MSNRINKNIVGIIGAGPAGISAAIQLKRNDIDFLIFEKKRIGGLIINANNIENYPGFFEGINGIKLISKFISHLKKFNIDIIYQEVLNIEYLNNNFIIKTKDNLYSTEYLIVASGTNPIKISPQLYPNISFFYEIDSLFKYNNRDIAIIGGGDAAFDYALTLSKLNQVSIFNKNKKPKCIPVLLNKCLQNENIKIFNNHELKKIFNDKKYIEFTNNSTFTFDEIVFAIGRKGNKIFLDKNLNIKYLENKNKLFFAGDVINNNFRQVGISVGDGLKVAMKITEIIKNE